MVSNKNVFLLFLTLNAVACGDVPLLDHTTGPEPATSICEADKDLQVYRETKRNTVGPQTACPVAVDFEGSGCVPCTYVDVCGGAWAIGGCSPAEGVWCEGTKSCPSPYEYQNSGGVNVTNGTR